MKKYFALAAIIMAGCFSRSAMMTQETYYSVQVGTPISTVIEQNGEPLYTETKDGMEEYHYVERMTSGNRLIYENHYIIYVKDGMVVAKTTSQERPPAFDMIYQDDPNHNQYP